MSAALCVAVATTGCTAPDPGPVARHIVMFDGKGLPVDLDDRWGGALFSYDTLDEAHFARHVEAVLDGVREHVRRTGTRDVVVFIHGGLNEQPETIRRAIGLADDMLADGVYPIFVNWQSNLVSSWFAPELFVRQGRDWGGWGPIVTPFVLATDLARSLFRFPVVAGHQAAEGLGSLGALELSDRTHARDAARELMRERARDGDDGAVPMLRLDLPLAAQGFRGRLSGSEDLGLDDVGAGALYVVTLPIKPVSIFLVDAAGTGSWQVMRRRVELLFQREDELETFDAGRDGRPRTDRRPQGLLLMMDGLARLQAELDLRITIVGHSMGTIVMNRLLFHAQLVGHLDGTGPDGADGAGHAPGHDGGHDGGRATTAPVDDKLAGRDAGLRLPSFEHVVYLAAACSLRDYEQSAFPYLLHDPGARVFHVVLDPDEELDEDNAVDLAPRGSLLVWVDDFLAQPSTPMDRTAGRYDNLVVALANTPRALRERVHVRVLPRGDATVPSKHGQFTDPADTGWQFRFWRREAWWRFWEGDVPVPAPLRTVDEEAFPR